MATFKQVVGVAAVAAIALSSTHSSLEHALAAQHTQGSQWSGHSSGGSLVGNGINDGNRIMASIEGSFDQERAYNAIGDGRGSDLGH